MLFLPLVSFRQFSKGAKFIGGSIFYTSFTDNGAGGKSPATTYFSFDGQLGFFLNESVSIGPALGAYANNYLSINPVTNLFESRKFRGFFGGVLARKFYEITERLLLSLEGKAMMGNVKGCKSFLQDEPKTLGFYLHSARFFPFSQIVRWAFDAGIGEVSYGINWNNPITDTDYFTANLGQVKLGVNYFFDGIDEK